MKIGKIAGVKIRNELILGLVVVILFSSIASYIIMRTTFKKNFDNLVEKNDIETATSYAEVLGNYYANEGSWSDLESDITDLKILPEKFQKDDRTRPDQRKPPKDSSLPLILTDSSGRILYSGIYSKDLAEGEQLPSDCSIEDGLPVVADESVLGYVFFKSMVFSSYNPQEADFIASISKLTGISVVIGIIFAVLAGAFLAGRFAKPITELDSAVRTITDGDMAVRVNAERRDEIGSLAGSFNLMADRLQGAEKARQSLLADIAHELRTPVSVIQANLEMIIDGVYRADESRLKSLYEETKILTSLISDLRSLSDLDSGIDNQRPEKINYAKFVEESCMAMQPLFQEKKVDLAFVNSCGEAAVSAEPEKLRQVFRNILGNALKYAPDGTGVKITLDISREEGSDEKFIRAVISDEGPGVPEEETGKIFDRFYRVDYSRNRESGGRGLGLAIAKKIVTGFNGRIGAYNNDPQGLSVWVELPKINL